LDHVCNSQTWFQFDESLSFQTNQAARAAENGSNRDSSEAARSGGTASESVFRCVPQDCIQARMWFNLPVAQDDPRAQKWRDKIAANMTPPQTAEAQRMAKEWKLKGQD
jgi:hypothetical protein